MAYELRCIQYTNSCERWNLYDVSHGGGRLSYICRKLLMEAAVLTLHQVILMMLLIAVGIACARLKWFSDEVAQALSRFLLWFGTPALLIDAFSRDYNAAEAHNLLLSGLLGIVFHLLAAGIAKLAIRCGDKGKCAVARMSAMYSNCGFMAFPLISAVLGEIGVFYGSAFVGMFNLSLWTQGRALLLGRKGMTMRGALCNAGVLGTIAGCVLYFCRLPLPGIAGSLAASLASLNTPLAMIVIGVFLSRCSLRSLLCREVLWPSLLRLEQAVLETLRSQIALAVEMDELIAEINRSGARSRSADHLQTERAQLETERERIEQMKLSLYPDWKAGDISREEYHRLKEQFEQQQARLDTRIASLQTRIDEAQNGVDETNSFLSQFIKYRNLQTLTREVIVELIDMIYVHEGGKITIKFKFSDAYAAVQDYIRKHGKTA